LATAPGAPGPAAAHGDDGDSPFYDDPAAGATLGFVALDATAAAAANSGTEGNAIARRLSVPAAVASPRGQRGTLLAPVPSGDSDQGEDEDEDDDVTQ